MEPLLDQESPWLVCALSEPRCQHPGELTLLTKARATHPTPEGHPGSPAPPDQPKTSCRSPGFKFYSALINCGN